MLLKHRFVVLKFIRNVFVVCCGILFYSDFTLYADTIENPKFTIITTDNVSKFTIKIAAAGNFRVDWGDGTVDEIVKTAPTTTAPTTKTHSYEQAGKYTIKMDGLATNYSKITSYLENATAISFKAQPIEEISGNLSAIFPTLPDATTGKIPSFYMTFYNCTSLVSIPEKLFQNITYEDIASSALPSVAIFRETFYNASSLRYIKASSLVTVSYLTKNMFNDSIPKGAFNNTFNGTKLVSSCPENTNKIKSTYYSSVGNKVFCEPLGCDAGMYMLDTECVDVGQGYYSPENDPDRYQCPQGLTTPGYGISSDNIADCGRILHIGPYKLYLHQEKKTEPALHIKVGDKIFYANASLQQTYMNNETAHYLKVKFNQGTNNVFYIYDDTIEVN